MMTTAHPDPRFAIGGPELPFARGHYPEASLAIPAIRAKRSISINKKTALRTFETFDLGAPMTASGIMKSFSFSALGVVKIMIFAIISKKEHLEDLCPKTGCKPRHHHSIFLCINRLHKGCIATEICNCYMASYAPKVPC